MSENNAIIKYGEVQISIFSDDKADYVCITDMAIAWKGRKSILSWIRNRQTVDFLAVWEKRHNPKFDGAQMSAVYDYIKQRTLTIKKWNELTNAKGIFTRVGDGGTYAHKDIAIRFAAWLSPEFEMYLVEEIQRLKKIEEQKYSYELLTHQQVLALVQLKEIFKYVAHQEIVEDAHKQVYAAESTEKNPFAAFNSWRNQVLEINPLVIDERIKKYCEENKIALTAKILNKSKRDKILMLDTYEAVRNAVWDFLNIKKEVNALNLANLVRDMIRTEKGEVLRANEEDLFRQKQDLGNYNNFDKILAEMPEIKTARQLLESKKKPKELTTFDTMLKGMLNTPPPKDKKK